MSELDYKDYSLKQLDNWIHDALSASDATPSEIYHTIIDVIVEYRDHHRDSLIKANELLRMMRGARPVKMEDKYTDEELDAMCDAAELQHNQ
ncbi:hypothetical protein [Synechococcus phage DSL-LC02]|nr:hypothetical protein [Synechococcus phage DSL-LC02]